MIQTERTVPLDASDVGQSPIMPGAALSTELAAVLPGIRTAGLHLLPIGAITQVPVSDSVNRNLQFVEEHYAARGAFGSAPLSTRYLDIIVDMYHYNPNRLPPDIFRNDLVIDLGAGRHADGLALAHATGAKAYVGVEPYWSKDLARACSEYCGEHPGHPKAFVAHEDMHTFLSRVPDASASIIVSAIDGIILHGMPHQMLNEISSGIGRVLSDRSSLLMFDSEQDLCPPELHCSFIVEGVMRCSIFRHQGKD